jgi:hypothetical protein
MADISFGIITRLDARRDNLPLAKGLIARIGQFIDARNDLGFGQAGDPLAHV